MCNQRAVMVANTLMWESMHGQCSECIFLSPIWILWKKISLSLNWLIKSVTRSRLQIFFRCVILITRAFYSSRVIFFLNCVYFSSHKILHKKGSRRRNILFWFYALFQKLCGIYFLRFYIHWTTVLFCHFSIFAVVKIKLWPHNMFIPELGVLHWLRFHRKAVPAKEEV